MNRARRTMAAAGRSAAWLLLGARRDWVTAVWAEAHEVPPGVERLAWRAGGVWMLAREALMPRRVIRAVLFAAAAGAAAWAAWPAPAVGHAAVSQFHVIATVLLLAGLPLLARRFLGPAGPSRIGRSLRVFCCAATLALLPTVAIVETFANLTPAQPAYRRIFAELQGSGGVPGMSSGGPPWAGEIVFLLLTAGYVGVILFLTSRRAQLSRSTLAIGTGTGGLFGVVMFAVAPLGLGNHATDPWLPGSDADPVVALAWVMLFGGPIAAALLASRRCRRPDGTRPPFNVRIGQGVAAGVLANGIGALVVSALGTGTTALMLKSPGLLDWLNHGQQLTAIAAYRYEIQAGAGANSYPAMLVVFPIIGLFMSAAAAACANPAPREPYPRPYGGGGPPGPGPEPAPELPPPGGRFTDTEEHVPVLS